MSLFKLVAKLPYLQNHLFHYLFGLNISIQAFDEMVFRRQKDKGLNCDNSLSLIGLMQSLIKIHNLRVST